jgi:hypothetical protein
MKSLIIDAVPDSPYYPEVNFNAETGICVISGESYMEEAYKFYTPLLSWLKEFSLDLKNSATLNIKLTYFNTNSSRLLLDMLDILKKAIDRGVSITVNWYFEEDDPDIKEEIEDFEIETGLTINMIPFD